MAEDKPYEASKYDVLSMEEKGLLAMPRLIEDVGELRRVWNLLHSIKAKGDLRDGWIRVLPSGYEHILDKKVVKWLWDSCAGVVPEALKGDWNSSILAKPDLFCLHVMRKRANALGMIYMRDYSKYVSVGICSDCLHIDGETYFQEVNKRSDRHSSTALFYYNEESESVVKEVLLDRDWVSEEAGRVSPLALRYSLEKWRMGKWTIYRKESVTLFQYAISLIHHLRGVSPLSELPYYSDKAKIEWSPGTIFVPNELREAVQSTIDNAPDTYNTQFLRNYYRVASEHILRHLHDSVSKEALARTESKCCIQ